MNNAFNDKKCRYDLKPVSIETVDQAVVDYYDKKLNIRVDAPNERKKVPIVFATGERWALIRDKKALRDTNGSLILPVITVRRQEIDKTPGFGAAGQEVPYFTISSNIHGKTANVQNLVETRKKAGFPEKKRETVQEFLTIPFPDFATVYYEIIIWTQYQTQMNQVLEKLYFKYEHLFSFVMPVEYDGYYPKGNGYYFVGFVDSNYTAQSNVEEFSEDERVIKYTFRIKVPAYLILDPDDETLSYGEEKEKTVKNVVFKYQNFIDVKLEENVISREEFDKLFPKS